MDKKDFSFKNLIGERKIDYAPFMLIFSVAVVYFFFCLFIEKDIFGPSPYSTYTLQALAWRDGQIHLSQNYPWLELAIFNGKYFVSFPPVPSIPMYFLTFIFGAKTPDNFMVKLYMIIGCLAIYYLLRRANYEKWSAMGFAFLCSFASNLFELTIDGGVWHQAQLLCFLLTTISLLLIWKGDKNSVTFSLLCYALSVGCRPFNVLYGFVLLAVYMQKMKEEEVSFKEAINRAIPGLILGLVVAFCYGLYNFVRFENIFEFGHNHLPEFSTQGGVQFSIESMIKNFPKILFGAPFYFDNGKPVLETFGFSMFLVNPVFLLMIAWIVFDVVYKRFSATKGVIIACFVVHLMLLLMQRTFGGFQFGARYTCDLIPYVVMYLALPGHERKMHMPEIMVMIVGFCFILYGSAMLLQS